MPVVYLPHGGGPWPFMTQSMGEPEALAALTDYLVGLRELCSPRPRAALVISAHWEEPVATVMTHPQPPLLFDYSGFPPETYRLTWGARTDLQLAARVQTLLRSAGLHTESDSTRGYDHGTFVPLKLTWPQGEMPIVQLSLLASLDPGAHIALGKALEPLRDEGILIVGSGMSFHNMRAMRMHGSNADSDAFDQWLAQTVSLDESQRNEQLARWASAPGGRASHPREEHLLPLMVVAGAAGQDRGRVAFRTRLFGATVAAHHFG
ncbi:MAG: class III extradiol ring-cleavage dioxygenase [Deltaproteobacteria bacterium]|nr:class III extradiol ring-cleavage dioxygenase [Deltaproteobacteria bacterium]